MVVFNYVATPVKLSRNELGAAKKEIKVKY
jgi:hypothetical protein